MGNTSIYLNDKERKKLDNVSEKYNLSNSKIIRTIFTHLPETYIDQIIASYGYKPVVEAVQ